MENSIEQKLSFAEHLGELRKRIVHSFIILGLGAGVAFAFNEPISQLLQRPLDDKLYYFSPAGGFSFSVQLAILIGVIVALPVIIYHIAQFISPAFKNLRGRFITSHFVLSILLAVVGIGFAYFVSLPQALRILKGLSPEGIEALIAAEDYAKFVMIYLAGFALLFQLPLIINFIDRIKPLQPKKLNHYQRHAFAGSFIFAAVLTPTPDVFNQAIFALPMILLFQVSVGIIAIKHWQRSRQSAKTEVFEPFQPAIIYPENWNHDLQAVEPLQDVPAQEAQPSITYVTGFDIGTPSLA